MPRDRRGRVIDVRRAFAIVTVVFAVAACSNRAEPDGSSQNAPQAASEEVDSEDVDEGVCRLLTAAEVAEIVGHAGPIMEDPGNDPTYCAWHDGVKVGPLATLEVRDAHGFLKDIAPSTREGAFVEQVHGVDYVVEVGADAPSSAALEIFGRARHVATAPRLPDAPIGDEDLRTSVALSLQRLLHYWDAIACDVGATPEEALRLVFDPDASGFFDVFDHTVGGGCVTTAVIGVEGPTSLEQQMEGGRVIARVATAIDGGEAVYWSANLVRAEGSWRLYADESAGPLVSYCGPPEGFDLPVPVGCP
jgi:hypothetical protein